MNNEENGASRRAQSMEKNAKQQLIEFIKSLSAEEAKKIFDNWDKVEAEIARAKAAASK